MLMNAYSGLLEELWAPKYAHMWYYLAVGWTNLDVKLKG
jgi:hypothetical protein